MERKMQDLQTLYICKQIPISQHKSENFTENGFQMWAIIQSLQISTQSCPKIRLCGWVKASHWTLVFPCVLTWFGDFMDKNFTVFVPCSVFKYLLSN